MARPEPQKVIDQYKEAQQVRLPNEPDWRISAAYCLPRHYNAWQTDGAPNVGNSSIQAVKRIAFDSTAARALPKYAAVLERIGTPHNMVYQSLIVQDKSLMKSKAVREYLESLRDLIFQYRYGPKANFGRSASEVFMSLGAYGTGPMYLGQRTPNALSSDPSFLYRACPLRDVFILVNDEGEVVGTFRRFYLNIRQFRDKWPQDELPACMAAKGAGDSNGKESDYFEFVHAVMVRTDFDPEAIDSRRHALTASYLCVQDKTYIGEERGFRSMPYIIPRTQTEAGNPYGYAPALQAQAAMGTASGIKKTIIKQGQKAVDPVLLAHDDGIMNGRVDLRPGSIYYGGVDKQGRQLIHPLQTGNFQVGEKLLEDERSDINDAFFVTLFQILMDTPEMTAAEVYERVAERASLLSPTMNAIQDEMLAPQTMREIDLLQEMGKLASGPDMPGLQMPPELVEAGADVELVYTSPMAKGMYAEEVSGFIRSVEQSIKLVEATGDMSHLDHYDFDTAIPEMADYQNVPARWMNDDKKKKMIAEARAQQQQQAQLMQNAAPLASAAKTAAQMQQGGAQQAPVPAQQGGS